MKIEKAGFHQQEREDDCDFNYHQIGILWDLTNKLVWYKTKHNRDTMINGSETGKKVFPKQPYTGV